mgnify:CR=1 FL=1
MMYGSDASRAGANVVAESPQFKQIRMSQKMEQLAEEDERVQSVSISLNTSYVNVIGRL